MTRCRNDNCEYRSRCIIAHTADQSRPDRPSTLEWMTSLPTPRPASEQAHFSVRRESAGWVGRLHIKGSMKATLRRELEDVEAQLGTLVGLLLTFETSGGSGQAQRDLERLVLVARQQMPVVAYIQEACSAALVPAFAADQTFIDPMGRTGVFGAIWHTCDGSRRTVIVSWQTPAKYDGEPVPWPPQYADEAERQRLQELADREVEADLRLIARYRLQSVDSLRQPLDGRSLGADEASAAGLVDGVCREFEAYDRLLQMINKRR